MDAADSLKSLLIQTGIGADSESGSKMLGFFKLLEKWNSRINLTASTKWGMIGPLFEEGIWAARFYAGRPASHLDVGSGAGFPGVLLRILAPCMQLDIVESRAKRAAFLESVIQEIGLSGTRVFNCRLDEHLRGGAGGWNCVSWKGLKLGDDDLSLLQRMTGVGAEFWMFHGKEPAVKNPKALARELQLVRSESFPGRRDWRLSIYGKIPKL